MDRYQQLFTQLTNKNQGAFVPFVTLGDPSPDISLKIIDTLIAAGADALELGIPFSDPLADGPTIQNATKRAFAANVTPSLCFDLLLKIRQKYPTIPIGLLLYANLVYRKGIENFYTRCQHAGIDSVLIADVPFHESAPFREAAEKYQIAPIFICPPNASEILISQIAKYGKGYTYLLSRAGVTGTENQAQIPVSHLVLKLKEYQAPPAIQGFGISNPDHVKTAVDAGAAGAISGSAIVKIIEQNYHHPDEMFPKISNFVKNMKMATIR